MHKQLKFGTLIDLFNGSLVRRRRIESPDKVCIEILRAERQETLTFGQLKTRANNFALWLIKTADIKLREKVAILGRNRADWDIALWGIILAGAIPVLIDPERGVEGVINHLLHTDTRLLVMADDYQDTNSRQELRRFTFDHGLALVEMTNGPLCQALPPEGSACRRNPVQAFGPGTPAELLNRQLIINAFRHG